MTLHKCSIPVSAIVLFFGNKVPEFGPRGRSSFILFGPEVQEPDG
jgi:methyl coenzyme M reductase subunit C